MKRSERLPRRLISSFSGEPKPEPTTPEEFLGQPEDHPALDVTPLMPRIQAVFHRKAPPGEDQRILDAAMIVPEVKLVLINGPAYPALTALERAAHTLGDIEKAGREAVLRFVKKRRAEYLRAGSLFPEGTEDQIDAWHQLAEDPESEAFRLAARAFVSAFDGLFDSLTLKDLQELASNFRAFDEQVLGLLPTPTHHTWSVHSWMLDRLCDFLHIDGVAKLFGPQKLRRKFLHVPAEHILVSPEPVRLTGWTYHPWVRTGVDASTSL